MKNQTKQYSRSFKRWGIVATLGALALVLSGCAASNKSGSYSKTIAIESEPAGIRVEVNGEDLGLTPTSYTVRPNKNGDFAGGWGDSPSVIFVAFPPEGSVGLFKQTKSFSPSGFMETGDRVPERIFFDMQRQLGR